MTIRTDQAQAQVIADAAWDEAVKINTDWRDYANTLTDPLYSAIAHSKEIAPPLNRAHGYHDLELRWHMLPVCGSDCELHNQAQLDAQHDFAAACERTVAPGHCTGCEKEAAELVPWSGERLCWSCVDTQLDLMAQAILEDGAVSVGTRGLR